MNYESYQIAGWSHVTTFKFDWMNPRRRKHENQTSSQSEGKIIHRGLADIVVSSFVCLHCFRPNFHQISWGCHSHNSVPLGPNVRIFWHNPQIRGGTNYELVFWKPKAPAGMAIMIVPTSSLFRYALAFFFPLPLEILITKCQNLQAKSLNSRYELRRVFENPKHHLGRLCNQLLFFLYA